MSDTSRFHRVWPPGKSRIVGPARQSDGTTTTAYQAVESLVCGQCGADIAPDALFSRHGRPRVGARGGGYYQSGLTQVPVCIACRPLRVEEDDGGSLGTGG